MRLAALAYTAVSLLAVLREATCNLPNFKVQGDSVYIQGCQISEYYEQDVNNLCNEVNVTSTPAGFLIGADGPEVENSYCCDDTCNSNTCANFSSSKTFIIVHKPSININISASPSKSITVDPQPYIYVSTISAQELTKWSFTVCLKNGSKHEYFCNRNPNTFEKKCFDDDNYRISNTSYSLTIFKIDLENPVLRVETSFTKYTDEDFVEDSGPTFYIGVEPAVSLSFDNASNIATCNVKTSLPATMRLHINNTSEEPPINSTHFSYDKHLWPGEYHLVCEVTYKSPSNVMLTSNDSQQYTVPNMFSTDPPSPSPSLTLLSLSTSPMPSASTSPTLIFIKQEIIIATTTIVVFVTLVLVVVSIIVIVLLKRHHSSAGVHCLELQQALP